jgi:hypothetical protein
LFHLLKHHFDRAHDMGMAAKTRPGIVLIPDNLNAPRWLLVHFPIASSYFPLQMRLTVLDFASR